MDLPAARALFPGTRDRAYLDAASIGLLPAPAAAALARLADDLSAVPARDTGAHHLALDRIAGAARAEVAKLINATASDIALVESTTHGLQIIADCVSLAQGDCVLVGETEYLGLAMPWIGRRQALGLDLVTVPHRDGRLLAEDFERALGTRGRVILLSGVQWNNGFRADLAAFSELARRRDVVLVLDAIQQLGAVPIDVAATPCDFLACGGHKWLNAPAGRGFLYVSPAWQPMTATARPRGYLHAQVPPQGWGEYFGTPDIPAVRDYDFRDDARAAEVGGFGSVAGNAVLAASVGVLNQVGPGAIARHVLALGDELIAGLERVGATVISPRGPDERSGIVSFTLGDVARDRALLARLLDDRVVLSQRYTAGVGGLRASVHLYNDRGDIDRLLDSLRRFTS